jgi:hypothetical protein
MGCFFVLRCPCEIKYVFYVSDYGIYVRMNLQLMNVPHTGYKLCAKFVRLCLTPRVCSTFILNIYFKRMMLWIILFPICRNFIHVCSWILFAFYENAEKKVAFLCHLGLLIVFISTLADVLFFAFISSLTDVFFLSKQLNHILQLTMCFKIVFLLCACLANYNFVCINSHGIMCLLVLCWLLKDFFLFTCKFF